MSNLFTEVNQHAINLANGDSRIPSEIQGDIFSSLDNEKPSLVYNTSLAPQHREILDLIAQDALTQAIGDKVNSLINKFLNA